MPTQKTRWWWVRHAPVINPDEILYGQQDLPCDCSDQAAFQNLARKLPTPAHLVTSNLIRTQETAQAIQAEGAKFGPAEIVADLKEQSLGDWEGHSYAQLPKLLTGINQTAWPAPAHYQFPNGESFIALIARVSAAIATLSSQQDGKDIVAVTHGGTIRAAVAFALGLDPEKALMIRIDNLSLTVLEHLEDDADHRWRVICVNEKSTR